MEHSLKAWSSRYPCERAFLWDKIFNTKTLAVAICLLEGPCPKNNKNVLSTQLPRKHFLLLIIFSLSDLLSQVCLCFLSILFRLCSDGWPLLSSIHHWCGRGCPTGWRHWKGKERSRGGGVHASLEGISSLLCPSTLQIGWCVSDRLTGSPVFLCPHWVHLESLECTCYSLPILFLATDFADIMGPPIPTQEGDLHPVLYKFKYRHLPKPLPRFRPDGIRSHLQRLWSSVIAGFCLFPQCFREKKNPLCSHDQCN